MPEPAVPHRHPPSTVLAHPAAEPWGWLLGPIGRLRLPIKRVLVSIVVYILSDLWRHVAALLGHADLTEVHWLAVYDMVCSVGFYVAMRSGWTRHLRDPAVTGAQCVLGILSIAASYVIVPDLRGVQVSMITTALLFSTFMSKPEQCRLLGWFALLTVSVAMLWASYFRPATFRLEIELLNLAVAAGSMPLAALIASQLCRIRNDLKTQRRELRAAMARIESLAICDELTGLPNRRHALDLIRLACHDADRTGAPLSFGYLDIDHFKRVNDTLGHAAGDQVLRLVAQIASGELRQGDLLARWGGEEFLLILPATGADDVRQVIDRLRQRLADSDVWEDCKELRVTFSAGAATRLGAEPAEQTLERADQALYRAKAAGRDCTMLADRSALRPVGDQRGQMEAV